MLGRSLPLLSVISSDGFGENRSAAIRAAVGQENEAAVRLGALREASREGFANVGASAKAAGTNEIESMLDGRGVCSHGLRLKYRDALIKEEQVEVISRGKTKQDFFERGIASFEFVPLHGEGVIEEQNYIARCSWLSLGSAICDEGLGEEEAGFRLLGWRWRCFVGRWLSGLGVA